MRRLSGRSWLAVPVRKRPARRLSGRRPWRRPNGRRRTARRWPARGKPESRRPESAEPPARLHPARPSSPDPPARFSVRPSRARRNSRPEAGVPGRGSIVVRRISAVVCPPACSLCIPRTAPAELSVSSVSTVSRRAVSPVGESGREIFRGGQRSRTASPLGPAFLQSAPDLSYSSWSGAFRRALWCGTIA